MLQKFWKYNCAGNDFILFAEAPPSTGLKQKIKLLCALHSGVGADGCIFVWKKGHYWNWRFFNADASETALCGNATRAVAHFLKRQPEFRRKTEVLWKGKLGLFRAKQLAEQRFEVSWPLAQTESLAIADELMESLSGFNDRGLAHVSLINVGVPHLVLINHELWNPQDRIANNPVLRAHSSLGRDGANVSWFSRKDKSACTFERGVEAETLACGSGALAIHLAQEELSGKRLKSSKMKFPGGLLSVRRSQDSYWLAGPVIYVYEGKRP